jgi:hypothetical protein
MKITSITLLALFAFKVHALAAVPVVLNVTGPGQHSLSLLGTESHTAYSSTTVTAMCTTSCSFMDDNCTPTHYPCQETVSLPYSVFDHDVEAQVEIEVIDEAGLPVQHEIQAQMLGEVLYLTSKGSKNVALVQGPVTYQKDPVVRRIRTMRAQATVVIHDLAKLQAATKVSDLKIRNGVISYSTGLSPFPIIQSMSGSKRALFFSQYYRATLKAPVLHSTAEEGKVVHQFNVVQAIGERLKSGTHEISVSAYLNVAKILNAAELEGGYGQLRQEAKMVVRVR